MTAPGRIAKCSFSKAAKNKKSKVGLEIHIRVRTTDMVDESKTGAKTSLLLATTLLPPVVQPRTNDRCQQLWYHRLVVTGWGFPKCEGTNGPSTPQRKEKDYQSHPLHDVLRLELLCGSLPKKMVSLKQTKRRVPDQGGSGTDDQLNSIGEW